MSSNKNHPKKGSRITVSPIRNLKDIKKIKRKLKSHPRDLLLFTLGVNNGLRISDLLNLRVGDVRDLEIGQTLKILEKKTGKLNVLMVNKETRKVLDAFLNEADPGDEEYLFKSRKGENNPITKSYVNQKVKEWTREMKGNYGMGWGRRIFGYRSIQINVIM
jgi:integrase